MVTATAMEVEARRRGAAFLFAATADCPPGLDLSIDDATEPALTTTPSYRFCGRYNAEMLKLALSTPAIDKVVLSARWTNWRIGEPGNQTETPVDIRLRDNRGVALSVVANAEIYERGLRRLVGKLSSAGKRVYIVGPVPEPTFNVPQRLFVEQFGFVDAAPPLSLDGYQRRHRRILALLAQLSREGQANVIWPVEMLCRRNVCPIESNGQSMFFDHNHLSLAAARSTAPLYRAVFR